MLKQEFKDECLETYKDYHKLRLVQLLNTIFKKGLRDSKDIADKLFHDVPKNFEQKFNNLWNNLTKEDKSKLRKYDNRN